MAKPKKVRIPYDDYRFEHVGKLLGGNQYMAFVTGAYPGKKRLVPANWQDVKRWIAVIHIFDAKGNHLETDARLIGLDREAKRVFAEADAVLDTLMDKHGAKIAKRCAIDVKLFSIEIDEVVYELVYQARKTEGDNKLYETTTLWPNDVVFYPPWNDGRYDT